MAKLPFAVSLHPEIRIAAVYDPSVFCHRQGLVAHHDNHALIKKKFLGDADKGVKIDRAVS